MMVSKHLSLDLMEQVTHFPWSGASTNRGELNQAGKVLRMAMEQDLTPRQRQCIELCVFQGLTLKEAGVLLGVNKSTVCRHLEKAKNRLEHAVSYARIARLTREE